MYIVIMPLETKFTQQHVASVASNMIITKSVIKIGGYNYRGRCARLQMFTTIL